MARKRPLHAVGVLPEVWEGARAVAEQQGETMTAFLERALVRESVRLERQRVRRQ